MAIAVRIGRGERESRAGLYLKIANGKFHPTGQLFILIRFFRFANLLSKNEIMRRMWGGIFIEYKIKKKSMTDYLHAGIKEEIRLSDFFVFEFCMLVVIYLCV